MKTLSGLLVLLSALVVLGCNAPEENASKPSGAGSDQRLYASNGWGSQVDGSGVYHVIFRPDNTADLNFYPFTYSADTFCSFHLTQRTDGAFDAKSDSGSCYDAIWIYVFTGDSAFTLTQRGSFGEVTLNFAPASQFVIPTP